MPNRTGSSVSTFQALGVASQFGITLAICVVLGYFAGHWLDERLNTGIIFTLIGVLIGLVAAVVNTVRLYNDLMRKLDFSTAPSTTGPSGQTNARTMESTRRTANDGDDDDNADTP
jgi:F0F1-type ATP synthase assembly protein I